MQEAGPYLGLGLQVAGGLLLFVGLGYLIDGWLDTTPWGMVLGAVLGMIGVTFLLIRVADEASAQDKARRERKAEEERGN
jgi:F0F1-type ATP synthase assembly protein I